MFSIWFRLCRVRFLGTISGGILPILMGLTGIVADMLHQNIPLILTGCGIIQGLIIIVMSLKKEFRDFLAYEEAPP